MALHLLPLLIFISTFSSVFSQSPILCHPAERDILLRIQKTTCNFWFSVLPPEDDCCIWRPVKCDGATGNVIGLDISSCEVNILSPGSPIFELRHLRNLALRFFVTFPIPSEIEKFTELEVLSLINVTGPIPSSIGNLQQLQNLNLGYDMSGSIPASIGNLRNLTSLNLAENKLSGSIPASIGNLPRLTSLNLGGNKLSGSIPESIGNLTLLETLALNNNNFTGTVPSPLFQLPNLKSLDVSSNRLQGLPRTNIRLDLKLENIELSSNLFTGIVPSWLFTGSLLGISASYNRFNGIEVFPSPKVSYLSTAFFGNNSFEVIPTSLFLLKNVSYLDLELNRLSGDLDLSTLKDMERLNTLRLSWNEGLSLVNTNGPLPPNLETIYMDHCNLTEFPNFLNSLAHLKFLDLTKNKMRGRIDLSKGWPSLSSLEASFNSLDFFEGSSVAAPLLEAVDLSYNNLIGDVPAGFCKVTTLDLSFNKLNGEIQWIAEKCFGSPIKKIILNNNKLHGSIPEIFFYDLRLLLLNGNNFNGKLPRSMANCKSLIYLDVGNNNITDAFPGFLENLEFLQVLILSSNNFMGNIGDNNSNNPLPFSNLLVLDASNNKFTGIVSLQNIRNFNYLTDWEIEYRYIYDFQIFITFEGSKASIKDILGDKRITFGSLDLSNNQFSGTIPPDIGNMKQLNGLNLNGNKFIGEIPKSFGKLINLESLDLSGNMLSGSIPQELLSLKSLRYLNLTNNQLRGPIPKGQSFSYGSYVGNVGLCGFPISKIC